MPDTTMTQVTSLLFAFLGLPLILQDIRHSSVSMGLLTAAFLIWTASSFVMEDGASRLVAAGVVLLLGALLLMIFPGRIGEADVVFMSGMAVFLPFWSLLIGIALGCIAALSAFVWLYRRGGEGSLREPIPFLPSLYWGGLTVMIGGIRL